MSNRFSSRKLVLSRKASGLSVPDLALSNSVDTVLGQRLHSLGYGLKRASESDLFVFPAVPASFELNHHWPILSAGYETSIHVMWTVGSRLRHRHRPRAPSSNQRGCGH